MQTEEKTVTTMTPETDREVPFWRRYGELWKHVPGSAVYLLAVFVLAITALVVLASVFWTGVGLLIIVVGIPIIVGALVLARAFGVADRYLLRLTGLPAVGEPLWDRDPQPRPGFWATLLRPARNAHYWVHLVHGMIVSPVLSTISFALTVTWLSVSLGGLTYWFWGAFLPDEPESEWGRYVADVVPVFSGWSSWAVEVTLYLLAGVVFAFTLPWALRGLALAHHGVARGMLGPWPSDALAAEVKAEAAARSSAVMAEDMSLRRLERDIHDGPQQRLVRLQMDLASLERRAAAGDTDAAAELAREARGHAKAALDELRALSSGVAPPLLQDRGLTAALEALALESGVPTRVELDSTLDAAVPAEIARTVYFVVAELLTNTVKHSAATGATLRAWVRPSLPGEPATLDVWLVDNGRGGARFSSAHGLEGLRERTHGLRGDFVVQSPLGGPTTIGVHIPLPGPAGAA
jgi:signal transduction histidine kinase